MTAVNIHCPACRATLRLPNRSMLGRKGKCPKCQHQFVLAEKRNDDVPLMLAEPPVFAVGGPDDNPSDPPMMTGTSPRWVPDVPAAAPPAVPAVSGTSKAPSSFPLPAVPDVRQTPIPDSAAMPAGDIPVFVPPPDGQASVTQRIRGRRRSKRNPAGRILLAAVGAIAAGLIIGVVLLNRNSAEDTGKNAKIPPQQNADWQAEKTRLATANEDAAALSPTHGEPIPLNYIPFTPHLVCHLRPSDLWQRDRQMKEFEATLGQVAIWLKDHVRRLSQFEPEEIQELTLAVNFGARTMEPDVAAVVRLKDARTPSDLMKRFRGKIRTDLDADVYESDSHSFLIIDSRTFAVAPLTMSDALAGAKKYPALAPPDLEILLRESDRARHFSLVFDVGNLDVHREYILIEPLQKVADQFVVWMGKDVKTVSWSLHLQPDLYLEMLLHQASDSSVQKIRRTMRSQIDQLPETILAATKFMKPTTSGTRRMIGRFPAMLKAVATATTADVGPNYVRLTTMLPGKAAANLAAGTLLTWNQSRTTDFTATPAPAPQTAAIPERVADRLKLPVLVDFRNFPLQEALAYIGDVIKTEIVIDGDALKAAGFTQNMPQTFDLGTVSAETAIGAILQKYAAERDPMVISVDENTRVITLSTKSVAAQRGLTTFPVPVPKP